jgi:phosphoribosylformylglycinamidine synthase
LLQYTAFLTKVTNINGISIIDFGNGTHALCLSLSEFSGLVACGGFSYGDVLGAGRGWASSILYNPRAKEEFEAFFNRDESFALGVCNGCQMLSQLSDIIPGSQHWPSFNRNVSQQFEAN